MKTGTQLFILFISLSFAGMILYLMKKNKLREEFSLIWFVLAILIITCAVFAKEIVVFFEFLNPDSAGEILLFVIIISQFIFILLFSVKLSSIKNQNKTFSQEIALLRNRLELIEKNEKK